MSNGVLIFAFNNDTVDYVKQSIFCAKYVKKYLKLPITVVTDSIDNFKNFPFYTEFVDNVIEATVEKDVNFKNFSKGALKVRDQWHNLNRVDAYKLSPYENTLVIDSDYIIANKNLLNLFNSNKEFAIAKKYKDFFGINGVMESRVSASSIPMYWATVMFFRKCPVAENIFNLATYIRDNWGYHRNLYNIASVKFRNDYAFSIAVHMMNGFTEGNAQFDLPYILYNSFDTDIPIAIDNGNIKILSNNRDNYSFHQLKNISVHIMNKFELDKLIDKELLNE